MPVESLRQSLDRILNSRHGMCEACPDYGLPFLGDLALSQRDLKAALAHAITVTVSKYEPRFSRVWVTPVADEEEAALGLTFRIEGLCQGRGARDKGQGARGGRGQVRLPRSGPPGAFGTIEPDPSDKPERVWYEARLNPDGRFEIRG